MGDWREHRAEYERAFLAAHGDTPPWTCCFCAEPITRRWTRGTSRGDALSVEHIDHDVSNSAPENLAPAHHSCNAVAAQLRRWGEGDEPPSADWFVARRSAVIPNLRLKRARIDAGLTQVELAQRCGLSERIVMDAEGKRLPRPTQQAAIAAALNVTPADIWPMHEAA